jgi:hypothetical protein
MRVSLKSILFAGLAVGAMGFVASAATVNGSSTVAQSGFLGPQSAPSYPLTGAGTPYDFTGQTNGLSNVTSIDKLTITLTANDGDTGPTDYDFNNLFLGLDGINTGLALNNLLNNNLVTVTIDQLPVPTQAALIAALQADSQLVGTVIDISPGNATPPGDQIGFPSAQGNITTTLDLVLSGPNLQPGGGGNPVPLPMAAMIAPLGAGVAGIYARKLRRQK